MVSTTESSGKQSVQYRLLVPRLSLMMFLQFFIWGSWSVTLGLVMSQHNMSLLIGDAFSAGPIASILSPFVLGMLVDRFFASQKVMAVMHLAGAAILWFVPQALVAQNGALLIGLLFGYTLCYMPTLALTNNIAFHSLSDKDKTFPVVRVFGTIGWIVAGIFFCPRHQRRGAIPAVSRHSAARRVLRLLLRGRLYLHRSYRRGKSKRSGAKHDRHVYLWERYAAGLANFRRTLQPAGGGANRASGVDHILVDPGSRCRSDCPDFPFLFQV